MSNYKNLYLLTLHVKHPIQIFTLLCRDTKCAALAIFSLSVYVQTWYDAPWGRPVSLVSEFHAGVLSYMSKWQESWRYLYKSCRPQGSQFHAGKQSELQTKPVLCKIPVMAQPRTWSSLGLATRHWHHEVTHQLSWANVFISNAHCTGEVKIFAWHWLDRYVLSWHRSDPTCRKLRDATNLLNICWGWNWYLPVHRTQE